MQQAAKPSFWQRSNDLRSRNLSHRLTRFVRARLRRLCERGLLLADDPRVLTAWRRGWDADHYVRLLRWRDQGFHPRVIYDIGAHAGQWSEMCQAVFAPVESVLFEPQPTLFERAKACQPPGSQWRVLPVALGDAERTERMHVTENDAASSLLLPAGDGSDALGTRSIRQTEVSLQTLDDVVARQQLPLPNLVKLDVQGYEGRVIAGGRNVIAQAEAVIVEVSLHVIYQDQVLLPEIVAVLAEMGFQIEDLNETCREWTGKVWQVDLWLRRRR